MIIFAEKRIMETARIQTVLRLKPELMEKIKRKARKEKRSFNSYVELLLEKEAGIEYPVLPDDFTVSEDIAAMGRFLCNAPDPQQLESDPKLAYLWEKYGTL